MKKFLSGFLVGAILMCAIPSLAKNDTVQAIYNNVKVAVNGENVTFASGEEPAIINNRTYVPAKYIAEALGATVKWDSKSSTVNIDETVEETATEPSAESATPGTTNKST
ncbi:MAG: copper amine oxidase N-terminal domain-containing protein, partial [Ruminiclostridium sp.]